MPLPAPSSLAARTSSWVADMLHKTETPRGTYAAWLTAAALAHQTADPLLRQRADRLHTEMKYAAKREQTRRARMNRN